MPLTSSEIHTLKEAQLLFQEATHEAHYKLGQLHPEDFARLFIEEVNHLKETPKYSHLNLPNDSSTMLFQNLHQLDEELHNE